MLNDKQLKLILALFVFAVAMGFYLATMAPTVSFWDCGELAACTHILGNPHPPGNPMYFILGRAFILAGSLFTQPVIATNFLSVLSTSLMAMMVFLFVEKFLKLLFKDGITDFSRYCSAIIAGFLVTFSDTVWFSAVETETYGTSFLVIVLVSWLALYWYENMESPKGTRALLLLVYLSYLGMGVNHFGIVAIPIVGFFVVVADKTKRTDFLLLFTGVAVLSVFYDIGDFPIITGGMLLVCILARLLITSALWKNRATFSMWVCICALLGFSAYIYVPIRSFTNVTIDENEPKSWSVFKDYLERKQYGSESMLNRAFHRRAAVQNQILVHPHMGYGGYMLAQYFPWKVGETRADESAPVVRNFPVKHDYQTLWSLLGSKPRVQFILFVLFQFPFLYGGYLAYKKNKALGFFVLMLYAFTSYFLLFYMNFADGSQMEMRDWDYWKSTGFNPQQRPENVHIEVRDRDYFFTPAFIYMGILFGIAAAFLLNKLASLKGNGPGLARGAGVGLVVLAMAVPVYSNLHEHNRRNMYVPWDYAYNLLMSCRKDAILFTNGDNDTFPLWFMQEVEGVRKDVRVVNLSLVNTDWYIHQLKTHEPKLVIGFTDEEIKNLEPQPWRFKQAVGFKVPNSNITVELEPRPYLKVQDIMVLHIVQNNYPKHPIEFAVTVSDDNMMGLEKYLIMEGMVYTLVEEKKAKEIDAAVTSHMVDSVYRFRGLGDATVFVDLNTEGLLTNYSATNFRLVMWAQDKVVELDRQLDDLRKQAAAPNAPDSVKAKIVVKEKERAEKITYAEKYLQLNGKILPREWRNDYYGAQFYSTVKDFGKAEYYYKKGITEAPSPKLFGVNLAQLYMEQNRFAEAEGLLNELRKTSPSDFELWYSLSDLYQKRGELMKAHEVLSEWFRANPNHQYAAMVAQQIQYLESQIHKQSQPKPDSNGGVGPGASAPGSAAPGAGAQGAAAQGAGGVPGLAPQAPVKAVVVPSSPGPAVPAGKVQGNRKDTALKSGTAAHHASKS